MLIKIGLVLLAAWVLGLLGVYRIGDFFHVFLLGALMLLLIGFLHARDAAARALVGGRKKET